MKRCIQIAFVTSVVFFLFILRKTAAANDKYVVPAKSNKYHYPSCRWAQKFRSQDMVTFHSPDDALGAGYIPCKVCKPPGKDEK
jgi:methylphosphotriester-DNA--protein-cysteine methyltransferase